MKKILLFSLQTALVGISTALLIQPSLSIASSSSDWGYSGSKGPSQWSTLTSEYATCGTGMNQSPIDIRHSTESDSFTLEFDYQAIPLQVLNNGHTIQINYGETLTEAEHVSIDGHQYLLPEYRDYSSKLRISGESYKLLQVHFHNPSEHTINGRHFEMEAHFVHQNDKGELAVVGVLLKKGKSNPLIQQVWQHIPQKSGEKNSPDNTTINIAKLLPNSSGHYHYRGSLTTPPCSEGVRWFVLQQPVTLSSQQIKIFSNVIKNNVRPTQPINQRYLIASE